MKRVVISDTHIGSKFYKGDKLIEFLRAIEYDELILAGDIIDFIKVPLFTKRAIDIANSIDFDKSIVYIVGNHDTPLREFAGREAFGMKFMKTYDFIDNGRNFRIEHGDSYDGAGIIHNNILMSFLSVSQNCIEGMFGIDLSSLYTRWKMRRKKLRRVWDILKINDDVDVFIMGHSHDPEAVIWVQANQRVNTYINSGDWCSHTTYVEIEDGVARLKEWL